MTWELLTGSRFYAAHADIDSVVNVATGHVPLASELPLTPQVQRELGNQVYQDSVMSMLARECTVQIRVARGLRRGCDGAAYVHTHARNAALA
jgi:hypothetical protein